MEENQALTNEQLESQLKSLRVKATITMILTYAAVMGIIIMWFFICAEIRRRNACHKARF